MSLDAGVRKFLKQTAEEVLKKADINEPPVKVGQIYEDEKLTKKILSPESLKNSGLLEHLTLAKIDQLRGVLFVPEQKVYVIDGSNYKKRHNFILAHELAHWVLPHHKMLLYQCTQFDLSRKARMQLEREANFFASEFGFMGDLFSHYLHSSQLSVNNIRRLSDTFDLSVEATLRRAVEISEYPCAFRKMKLSEEGNGPRLFTVYAIHSESFKKKYGELTNSSSFDSEHGYFEVFEKLKQYGNNEVVESEVLFGSGSQKNEMNAEMWKNPFDFFVFLQPKEM